MKVLHLIDRNGETTETFIRLFLLKANQFARNYVVTFQNKTDEKDDVYVLPKRFYDKKNVADYFPYLKEKIFGLHNWERAFLRCIRDFNPDIIHCHFGPMGLALLRLIQQKKIHQPMVVSFYGYDVSSLPIKNPDYSSRLLTLFKEKGIFAFGEGPALCEKIIALGMQKKRVMVNPLVVDIERRAKEYASTNGKIKFLMIGRFVEKKGFGLALEALGQLKDMLPPFKIDIIGFGELEKSYHEVINKYSFETCVNFLGKQPHEVVKEALCNYDFFLHPSVTASDGDSEGGAPTIIIEAQAAGIPVIASNHADIPYVMGYHQFLAQEGDIESLKEKIIKAVEYKSWDKLINLGRHHVEKQHSMKNSTIYENNLRKIIDNLA